MDKNAARRQPHVAACAGRDDQPEVRQIRLLVRQHTAAEAQVLVRLALAAPRQEGAARSSVATRLLAGSAFRDPMMPFVAVEEIVRAQRDGRGGLVLELQESRAVAGRQAGAVERPHAGPHDADAATQQAYAFDLMRQLIEGDAAAVSGIELIVPMRPQEKRSEEHTSELQSLRHLVC